MADNLPLIPEKESSVCADVRPILREVFRELDYLPPLTTKQRQKARGLAEDEDNTLPTVDPWFDKYDANCKEIWQQEGLLKQQHARRKSREPLPNIYKLYPPKQKLPKLSAWKGDQDILQRRDLMPSIVQNAAKEDSLWVKNTLNRSSGELSSTGVRGSKMHLPVRLLSPTESNFQSLSMGEIVPRAPPPPLPAPPPPPLPEYIICVPPQLDFVNFTIGQLHTQSIRLVNVSKFECRLSVKPPTRRELDVELCGARGLTVTSGAAALLKVHFRPRDVRVLHDALRVRVSCGRALFVPICCYMQPPLLDILVPAVPSSILSWSGGARGTGPVAGSGAGAGAGGGVVELGARLLGDVHCVRLLLHCEAAHAAFFILTEDAWLSFCLDALSDTGALVADGFVVWPAWWAGGGAVVARAWCRARCPGLHATALRVLSSTAVVRPLHLLADSLYFRPDHVTIEAHSKDYDICSADDPDCQYYVHLGTAFPRRPLSASVQLVNHSPVVYSYYWSVRPWGVCSCWEEEKASQGSLGPEDDSERLCVGAKEARDMELEGTASPSKCALARRIRVEPARGSLAPRGALALHVCAPDAGADLGTKRAVLMLILKDIPKESFPNDYDPMIVKTEEVNSDPIPGIKGWSRSVCEVVVAQMEVWWEVAPVRFVLDPPALPLRHSRRVGSVEVSLRATQLFGSEGIRGRWLMPRTMSAPASVTMTAAQSCAVTLRYPLPVLPNDYPETDVITLESADKEWQSHCSLTRQCETRHPALRPALRWLGVHPPGAHLNATLKITNDTHQHICWWATPFRWIGENAVSGACAGAAAPCPACRERRCSCALLRPARGALVPETTALVHYDVNAPEVDGCVCTLVAARRTSADVCRVAGGAGLEARASLLCYRVLAPRLVLRVLPCAGDKQGDCAGCGLDEGGLGSARGTATLRPRAALVLSRPACYRLRVSNLTPIPTALTWDPPLEDDALNVLFIPKELEIDSYGVVDFQVVVEARRVCGRRAWLRRARVRHAYRPLYLIIDAELAGLEVICELPIGEDVTTDSTLIMRRSQREEFPRDADQYNASTSLEVFQEEDRQRAIRAENLCRCRCELRYIPPTQRPRAPPDGPDDYPPVEIVWERPEMTRVCPCFTSSAPVLPTHAHPLCLQYTRLPLHTVRTRTVRIRNLSLLPTSWSAVLRHRTGSAAQHRASAGAELRVSPRGGELRARAHVDIAVRAHADTWGLYRDQLLIQIEKVSPIVVDVWMEAVGPALLFAVALSSDTEATVTLWMSASDPQRALRVKNNSRSELTVHCYLLTEHDHEQDALPFRLYLRFFDVLPRTCPCVTAFQSESVSGEERDSVDSRTSSYEEEMDTGIEIFLSPDYGRQEKTFFKISPETRVVSSDSWVEWQVALRTPPHGEVAPRTALLLRALPLVNQGEGWFRPDPPPQVVRLRQTVRRGLLKVSLRELRVKLCALDLPLEDVLRVRKRFRVQNVGCGPLDITTRCKAPWSLVLQEDGAGNAAKCGAGCCCGSDATQHRECQVPLYLLPRSSMEMCVEVRVSTAEAWPACPACLPCAPAGPPSVPTCPPSAPLCLPTPRYEEWSRTLTKLRFYDTDNVLLSLPMHLELEYPVIHIEPALIDFGFVTDGDTRKSYFTVSHSSRTVTIDMVTEWVGGKEFHLWPRDFSLQPGGRERVYIQYTARWCGAPTEGAVRVRAAGAGGAWCGARGAARAAPARDADRKLHVHDHTDDQHLLSDQHTN